MDIGLQAQLEEDGDGNSRYSRMESSGLACDPLGMTRHK